MTPDDLFWAKYNLSGALGREEGLKARVAELEKERDDLRRQVNELKAYLVKRWLSSLASQAQYHRRPPGDNR